MKSEKIPAISAEKIPPIYSWSAIFNEQHEQLIEMVRKSHVFDEATLKAFDESRQADGTYSIDSTDSVLLNSSKSVINIFYSLQNVMPDLLRPFIDYMQTDNIIASGFHLAKLTMSGFRNLGEIKKLISDVWYLKYYLQQLKSVMVTLPPLDKSFLPLINALDATLRQNVEPFLKQIQLLKAEEQKTSTTEELIQSSESDAIFDIGLVSAETATELEEEITLDSNVIMSICDQLDTIKVKVDQLIKPHAIKADQETGLYTDTAGATEAVKNLVNAANALTRFKAALGNVDVMIKHRELHVLDMLREVGHAIQALQQIQFNIDANAQTLLSTLNHLLKGLEPILVEITRWLEVAECRLGLRNESLQEKFRHICENYKIIATLTGIELKQQYPYWNTRLSVRTNELAHQQKEYTDLQRIQNRLTTLNINEETSLRELLNLVDDFKKIKIYETATYPDKINRLINIKTGMTDLTKEIKQLENKVRNSDGKDEESITKLKKLYQLQKTILQKIDNVKKNINEPDNFFYDKEKGSIINDQSAIMDDSLFNGTHIDQNILEKINTSVVKKSMECERLHHLVAEAEDEVIGRIKFHDNANISLLFELKKKIKNTSSSALCTMPLSSLQNFIKEIQIIDSAERQKYEAILHAAIEDRCGLTELNKEEKELTKQKEDIDEKLKLLESLRLQIEKNQESMDVLKRHVADIQSNPNQVPKDALFNELCGHLGVHDEDGIKKLRELAESYQTYFGWGKSWFLGHPLVNVINERITKLTDENKKTEKEVGVLAKEQELYEKSGKASTLLAVRKKQEEIKEKLITANDFSELPQGEYRGTLLETWKDAKYLLLSATRKEIQKQFPEQRKRSNVLVAPKQSMMSTNTIRKENSKLLTAKEESTEALVKRLQNEKKSPITIELQSYREAIIKIIAEPYFSKQQLNQFNQSKLDNGMFSISASDPLIIKNIKSFLNVFARFELLVNKIQDQFQKIFYQSIYMAYLYSPIELENIKALIKDFQIELRDLFHYIDQLKSNFNIFPTGIEQPAALVKLHEIVHPTLIMCRNWLGIPGISEIMNIDLTKQINHILVKLNDYAESPKLSATDEQQSKYFSVNPLNKSIEELRAYLDEQGIPFKEHKPYKIKDSYSEETRSILMLTNLLLALQRSIDGIINISKKNTFKGGKDIFISLSSIYEQLKKLNRLNTPKIRSIIKNILKDAHPLLVQIAVGIELSQNKSGVEFKFLGHDLNEEVHHLCQEFEKMAVSFNVTFESYYPYVDDKLVVIEREMKQKNENLIELKKLKAKLPTITNDAVFVDFGNESLSSLVTIRNAIKTLRPTMVVNFYDGIVRLIEQKTGLKDLKFDIEQTITELKQLENGMADNKKSLISIQLTIEAQEKQRSKLTELQTDIAAKKLSIEEIEDFYSSYHEKLPVSFEQLCHLFFYQPYYINNFIDTELTNLTDQLDKNKESEAEIESALEILTTEWNTNQSKLKAQEKLQMDLEKATDEMSKESNFDQTVIYDTKTKNIAYGSPSFAANNLVNVDTKVITELNQTIEYLEVKTKKLNDDIVKIKGNRSSEIQTALDKQKEKLIALEKKMRLPSNTLSKYAQTDESIPLLEKAKRVHDLGNLRGFLSIVITEYDHDATKKTGQKNDSTVDALNKETEKKPGLMGRFIRNLLLGGSSTDKTNTNLTKERYKNYLDDPTLMEDKMLTDALAKKASNHSGFFGRLVRSWFRLPSTDDIIYKIATEFNNEKNVHHYFTKEIKEAIETPKNKGHVSTSTEIVAVELGGREPQQAKNILKESVADDYVQTEEMLSKEMIEMQPIKTASLNNTLSTKTSLNSDDEEGEGTTKRNDLHF